MILVTKGSKFVPPPLQLFIKPGHRTCRTFSNSVLERGRAKPSLDTLERLARFYEMSVSDLVSGIEGWGTHSVEGLAPGIIALLEKNVIDERVAQDLNRIELRGKRPQTEEEWHILYQNLEFIMRSYLKDDETKEE